jgi:hypothetical protein
MLGDSRLWWAFVPLLAFTLVEWSWGTRPAIVIAVLLAVGEVGWGYVTERRVRWIPTLMAALVVVLGGLSLLSDDPVLFLWTPVIGDLVFAAVLVGSVLTGNGMLRVAVREADPDQPLEPELGRFLDAATLRMAGVLVAHAALTAWSTTQDRAVWTFVSGPGQYLLTGLQVAGEVWWARTRLLPRLDAARTEEDAP